MNSLNLISTLLSGFSIVSALILFIAYIWFLPELRKTAFSKFWCGLLLAGLISLQCFHIGYFVFAIEPMAQGYYGLNLLLMPPTFYFFSRASVFHNTRFSRLDLLHLIPLIVGLLLPNAMVPLYAFFVGSGYTLWFVSLILNMRGQQARFKFELFFFGLFAVNALLCLFLVAALPFIAQHWFFSVYSMSISLAFILVTFALIVFPELLSDVAGIVEAAYAKSHLSGLNLTAIEHQLEQLMTVEKRYQDEDLKLANLAEELGINGHQLSELINTRFGVGFPKYVREHRIRAAKILLLQDLNAPILAIGMETGFKSQSAFYAAFKETEGMSPGQFRTNHTS